MYTYTSSMEGDRSYIEADDPRSQWVQGEEADTLIIDVSGFKKEDMRVLITTSGSLKISGECRLDGNRWARFFKNFTVPKNSNPRAIQAKFDKDEGLLFIVLPKKVPQHAGSHEEHTEKLLQSANAQTMAQSSGGMSADMAQMRKTKKRAVVLSVVAAIVVIVGVGAYLGYRMSSW